jgi:hypothetical protein
MMPEKGKVGKVLAHDHRFELKSAARWAKLQFRWRDG